uniref:RdRp n=1 Tax=Beihai picobirna-like virus 6 TaxID=1922523 RepID=A0A1L3KL91_9VIRU|nr:RdRp [Beihai picobirna-like virus 6]
MDHHMNEKETHKNQNLMSESIMSKIKVVPVSQTSLSKNPSVKKKLNAYSEREIDGVNIDYRTPFYAVPHGSGSPVVNSRISGVPGLIPVDSNELYNKLAETGVFEELKSKEHPDVMEFEETFKPKVPSSSSIKLPWDASVEKLTKYFDTVGYKPEKSAMNEAIRDFEAEVRKVMPAKSLSLMSLEAAMDTLPSSSNWGAPFFLPGKEISYNDKGEEIATMDNSKRYLVRSKEIWKTLAQGQIPKLEDMCARCGWSGQEGNSKDGLSATKQRIMWECAHCITLINSSIQPYLDAFNLKMKWKAGLSDQSEVDASVSAELEGLGNDESLYGFDASGFDFHISHELIRAVVDVILRSFQLSKEEYKVLSYTLYNMFVSMPIITPNGIWEGATDNVKSGDKMTNNIDSSMNWIGASYVKIRTKLDRFDTIQNVGDDSVIKTSFSDLKVLKRVSEAYSELGWEVNVDKQWFKPESVSFLKRLHVKGSKTSYRSYTWVFIGLCNMEYPKGWSLAMYSASAIMQTSNLSPEYAGYDTFMQFAAAGDPMKLGLKSKGGVLDVLRAAGSADKVAERLDFQSFVANQNGIKKKGSNVSISIPDLNTAIWVSKQQKSKPTSVMK